MQPFSSLLILLHPINCLLCLLQACYFSWRACWANYASAKPQLSLPEAEYTSHALCMHPIHFAYQVPISFGIFIAISLWGQNGFWAKSSYFDRPYLGKDQVGHMLEKAQLAIFWKRPDWLYSGKCLICHVLEKAQLAIFWKRPDWPYCGKGLICHILEKAQLAKFWKRPDCPYSGKCLICHILEKPQLAIFRKRPDLPYSGKGLICHILEKA